MADRNEIFRIILEGRDKLSGTLDNVTKSVGRLDNALDKLKKQKVEEFPLFGGGRATRGPGGQFIKAEDISRIDLAKRKIEDLTRSVRIFRKEQAQQLPLFGGGTAGRDPQGRFTRNETTAQQINKAVQSGLRSFQVGVQIAETTRRNLEDAIAQTQRDFKERKLALKKEEDEARVSLTAQQQAERIDLNKQLFDLSQVAKERKRFVRDIAKLEFDEISLAKKERVAAIIDETKITKREKEKLLRDVLSSDRKRAARAKEDIVDIINFELSERKKLEQQQFTSRFQAERAGIGADFTQRRLDLERPDLEEIQKQQIQIRKEALAGGTVIERSMKRAGLAVGDLVRGFRSARSGVRNLERDTNLVRNAFTRFGFAVGNLFKNFDQLVNLRWVFITGILTTFFTIVTQLGTALVALAASAIQAGAALGGALAAGAAQAAPVIGLLAVAFNRFNAALDAVKLDEKLDTDASGRMDNLRNAAQRLEDQQWSLKRAIEAVGDAQFNLRRANRDVVESLNDQRRAARDLAEARRQAARDIVDANFEERDAALSLAEAELAVLQAKQRLREEEERKRTGAGDLDEARAALREANERLKIAKQQADESEISAAQHQVTIAEQNLNAIQDQATKVGLEIKDAQLGLKRAELTREQAVVRDRRARQEATKARREGIEGAEIVKTAQERLVIATQNVADAQRNVVLSNRNVRDALHQVAVAQREVADAQRERKEATEGSTAADEAAKKAFSDLAPAEKKLFASLKRIRETFKRVFSGTSERDGILGPITLSLSRFIDRLEKMLRDPKLQKAASGLAKALAAGIDEFTKFVSNPAFRDDLIFFIEQATKNIPTIVKGMLNLFQVFLDIARAATPIFNRLLDRFVGATDKAKGLTSQKGEVRRPEEGMVGQIATINESNLDRVLSLASKHLDSWINLGVAIGNIILAVTGSGAATSGRGLLDRITDSLNEWAEWIRANDASVTEFFERNAKAIGNLAETLGRLVPALVEAFSSEEFLAFAQVMAEVIIPGLVAFIKALGILSKALIFILEIPIVGDLVKFALTIAIVEKAFNKILPVTQKLTDGLLKLGGAMIKLLRQGGLTALITRIRVAMTAAATATLRFVTALGRAVVAAGVAAVAAFKRLATVISTLVLRALFALRLSIRALVASTGIGALILAGVLLIENWDKVKKYARILADFLEKTFKRVVSWVRENWKKLLLGAILAPFLLGGLLLTTLYRFRDRILGIFKTIAISIENAFKRAFRFIREKFNDIIDFIKGAYDKLPGPLKAIIRGAGKVAGAAGKVAGKAGDVAGEVRDRLPFAGGGIAPGLAGTTDTVPAMLTPGEWVLNKKQQSILAARAKMTVEQLKASIFGTNSSNPPKARNNGRGKKVQYYGDFNLVSQEDPDGVTVWFIELADGSFGQVTKRDATRIESSNGTWIPNYVKRSVGGFKQNVQRVVTGGISGFSMGGIVPSSAVQRFATGGVVQSPGHGNTSNKNVVQNFNVNTQGQTDWGYVMRLGAISAQESF